MVIDRMIGIRAQSLLALLTGEFSTRINVHIMRLLDFDHTIVPLDWV